MGWVGFLSRTAVALRPESLRLAGAVHRIRQLLGLEHAGAGGSRRATSLALEKRGPHRHGDGTERHDERGVRRKHRPELRMSSSNAAPWIARAVILRLSFGWMLLACCGPLGPGPVQSSVPGTYEVTICRGRCDATRPEE